MAAHQHVKERWPIQPRAVRLMFLALVIFITGIALLTATLYNKDGDMSAEAPNTTGQQRSWRIPHAFQKAGVHMQHAPDSSNQHCSSKILVPKVCNLAEFWSPCDVCLM